MTPHEPTPATAQTLDDPGILDDGPLTFPVPGFETTTTRISPGGTHTIDDGEWNGALIVVTAGSVDLECHGGATHPFPAGSILWLSNLGLRAIHNHDTTPAVLLSTRRTNNTTATRDTGHSHVCEDKTNQPR